MNLETQEANQVIEDIVQDVDTKIDAFLDEAEGKTATAPSTENKTEGGETQTAKTTTTEVAKSEQVKEVENDSSLSVEDKINKVKEILGDDIDAIDAYVKEKGYHNDPAWQQQREIINRQKEELGKSSLSEEEKERLAKVDEITNSREYIEASMRKEGYKEEAIQKVLKEKGFDVGIDVIKDDFDRVMQSWNITKDKLKPENVAMIEDIISIVQTVTGRLLEDKLSSEVSPLKEHIEQKDKASAITNQMITIVKNDGDLDFDKDIEPELNKYLDQNKDATQEDIYAHFKEIYPKLRVERLKQGGKQVERDSKKENLRSLGNRTPGSSFPEKNW